MARFQPGHKRGGRPPARLEDDYLQAISVGMPTDVVTALVRQACHEALLNVSPDGKTLVRKEGISPEHREKARNWLGRYVFAKVIPAASEVAVEDPEPEDDQPTILMIRRANDAEVEEFRQGAAEKEAG